MLKYHIIHSTRMYSAYNHFLDAVNDILLYLTEILEVDYKTNRKLRLDVVHINNCTTFLVDTLYFDKNMIIVTFNAKYDLHNSTDVMKFLDLYSTQNTYMITAIQNIISRILNLTSKSKINESRHKQPNVTENLLYDTVQTFQKINENDKDKLVKLEKLTN